MGSILFTFFNSFYSSTI